ncbi:MAG: PAS domain S-box protein [Planctomycetota bacterium]|nr:PAS domain S-box protein [Planctomycetota bacterium]
MEEQTSPSLPTWQQFVSEPDRLLEDSSFRMKAVVDRTEGYLLVLSSDGTVLDINAGPLSVAGFRRDSFLGQKFWRTPFWQDAPRERSAVKQAVLDAAAGKSSRGEWVLKTADGSHRTVARSVTPVKDKQQNVVLIIAEAHDITDRIAAERELQESQQQLRTLIDHAPEAVVMLDCDSERFMDANTNAEQLFGMTSEELLQVGPLEISPSRQAGGRESQELAREMIQQALSGKAPVFEWTHRTSQGDEIICEVRLVQLPWSGRNVLRGSVTDITDRKRMEAIAVGSGKVLEQLARGASLEEVLTLITETIERQFAGMLCSILQVDRQQNCLRHGAAPSLPDFYNQAVDGLQIGPRVGSCGAAAFNSCRVVVDDVMTHENWVGYRELAQQANIRACWSQPIMSSQDEVLGTFAMYYRDPREPSPQELEVIQTAAHLAGIAIERTRMDQQLASLNRELEQRVQRRTKALEHANEQLSQSNRDLEQFAYAASHDLREPLRAVSGFCELLRMRYQGKLDETADGYLNHVGEGVARMQELLDGLLAYSRLGSTRESLQPVECEAALDESLANLGAAISSSSAVIRRQSLPHVVADHTQLVQLFQNLVGNAIKFRGERVPEVEISALPADDFWRISVRDNGIGIDPAYHKRIFEIFDRLHTRDTYPGLGIGLALCKRIVDRHGGELWVESQPGEGCTFHFTLPAA